MKKTIIAIHHTEKTFSVRWIEYCQANNVEYKIVNCYDSDIIQQLEGCSALMWHIDHMNYSDFLCAKQIIHALDSTGKPVFPDINTSWHFDDKIAQKYLFEANKLASIDTWVFYSKKKALEWIGSTSFPKVFKLKGGSGSSNVKLVRTKYEATRLVNKAFGRGFSTVNYWVIFKERLRKYKMGKVSKMSLAKWTLALFLGNKVSKMYGRERGYAYFQEFIPNNLYDIRVVVVGDKAFALKRHVRKGDFRASGSGYIEYDKNAIPLSCLEMAFKANSYINAQSIAFDFVFDLNHNPLIVEVSFGYAMYAYDKCQGYWDSNLQWHNKLVQPQYWMVENILLQTRNKS